MTGIRTVWIDPEAVAQGFTRSEVRRLLPRYRRQGDTIVVARIQGEIDG